MPEIQNVSHTHNAIADWMLLNPEKTLRECSEFFGYTQAWLSVIIHSDAFQAHLRAKQGGFYNQVVQDLSTKLRAAADIGAEKLQAMLEKSEEPRFVLDATDKILHRLGYAPQRSAPAPVVHVQQNVYAVPQEVLAEHRATLLGQAQQVQQAQLPPPIQCAASEAP